MIRIQPANTLTGEYDVHRPQPYPYFIEPNGDVARQDVWQGDPAALIGFQRREDVQTVDLTNEEFQADPQRAVGMFPVFVTAGGVLFVYTLPINSVTFRRGVEVSDPKSKPTDGLALRLSLGTWSKARSEFIHAGAELHGFPTSRDAHEFRAKLPAYVQKFCYLRRWKGGSEAEGGSTFLLMGAFSWETSTHKRLHRFVKAAQEAGARVEVVDAEARRTLPGAPEATEADVLTFYGLTGA